jgi:thioesterase domain-containing protein
LKNLATRITRAILPGGRKSRSLGGGQSNLERIMEQVKQANAIAGDSYIPRNYPGKITLFWCSDTPLRAYRDRRIAWSQVAGGGLEVHAIPGNHLTMVDEPHVGAMAQELRDCLHKVQPRAKNACAAD